MNKKRFLIFFSAFFSIISAFSFSQNDIKTYAFENGLTLYFLEDPTAASVRTELNVFAGFSKQSPENAGLFNFYADLRNLEITPDCVKIQKTLAPQDFENFLTELSEIFSFPPASDAELSAELRAYKARLTDFSSSDAGFINRAIDSKVFSPFPWKQESGINPDSFEKADTQKIRAQLKKIHENYYTPENALMYVSGNITEEAVLSLCKKVFGNGQERFSKSLAGEKTEILSPPEKLQKFVITGGGISKDITQIVIQYADFDENEADFLAAVLNSDNSEFKKLLLKQRNLSIPGAQYIDVSSAQQKNSSRLIVQGICQKTKVSPLVQAELFLEMTREKERIPQDEADAAVKAMNANFEKVADNSTLLMKNLAVFNQTNKDFSQTLFSKQNALSSVDAALLSERFSAAKPFVFVLCNSELYDKEAKNFKKAGYTQITPQNAAWYRQKKYARTAEADFQTEKKPLSKIEDSAARFIRENKAQFFDFTLSNGIPVTVKNVPGAKTAAISLAVDGGELLFAKETPGLSSVLVNSLAALIQWNFDFAFQNQIIHSSAEIQAENKNQYSLLTAQCASTDCVQCIKIIADTIIFADITPSLADGISYDLRSQWKIKCGRSDFQLLCRAINEIYKEPFKNLYDDTKDKPAHLEFTDIAESYPLILDASRFSIVITGAAENRNSIQSVLDETFGNLGTAKKTQSLQTKVEKLPLPKIELKHRLRHQFFSDIPADKAGPRPAILIPTTDFSDPILYLLDTPDLSSGDNALFNAILYMLEEKLRDSLPPEQTPRITPASTDIPYAQILITKVKSISKTNALFEKTVENLQRELEKAVTGQQADVKDLEKNRILVELESLWTVRELKDTENHGATAKLIHEGKILGNEKMYLEMYETVSKAAAEDYFIVAKTWLKKNPPVKIYSMDTKY